MTDNPTRESADTPKCGMVCMHGYGPCVMPPSHTEFYHRRADGFTFDCGLGHPAVETVEAPRYSQRDMDAVIEASAIYKESYEKLRDGYDKLFAEHAALQKRIKELEGERFNPLGDNHHNAAKCPHCNPEFERQTERIHELEQKLTAAEKERDEANDALAVIDETLLMDSWPYGPMPLPERAKQRAKDIVSFRKRDLVLLLECDDLQSSLKAAEEKAERYKAMVNERDERIAQMSETSAAAMKERDALDALCPEDVGPAEYILSLQRRLENRQMYAKDMEGTLRELAVILDAPQENADALIAIAKNAQSSLKAAEEKIAALMEERKTWLRRSEPDLSLDIDNHCLDAGCVRDAPHDGPCLIAKVHVQDMLANIEQLRGERDRLRERMERQTAWMERNVGELVFCEYCRVAMVSGEDGYEVFASQEDDSETFEVCDNCAAAAKMEKG